MSKELILRLRNSVLVTRGALEYEPIANEAADALEAAEQRTAELEAERDRQYDQNCEQIVRIAELEAQNKRQAEVIAFTEQRGIDDEQRITKFKVENERLRAVYKAAIAYRDEGGSYKRADLWDAVAAVEADDD